MSPPRLLTRSRSTVLPLMAATVLLCVWATGVHVSKTAVFPSPLEVARGLFSLTREGRLLSYLVDSLQRVALGFFVAFAVGLPLGLLMALSREAFAFANPVIQLLRPISPIAWMPVAIILFGVSELATAFLIFLASVLPLTLSVVTAARRVPAIYVRAGRNMGLSRAALVHRIVLPAALPEILVGVRVALGVAWLVLVAAEMIAVDSGLGYLIIDARNAGKRYDLVVAGMLLIGVVGLLLDFGVARLERLKSVRWGFAGSREERG